MQKHAQYPDKTTSIKLCSLERFNVRAWDGEAAIYDRESGDLHYLDSNCYECLAEIQSIFEAEGTLSCPIARLDESSPKNERNLLTAIAHLEKIGFVELLP